MADLAGWRVVVEAGAADVELVGDRLFQLGALAIEERPLTGGRIMLLAGMADQAGAARASGELADARIEAVFDDGWADAWREFATPVRVGDVVVQPAWLPAALAPAGVTVVTMEPGRAFGSGSHESTRLALEELLDLPIGPETCVLDVGCGSGVLGVACAAARGARVVAIDVDPRAVEVTADNAERNGVGHLVAASPTPIELLGGAFDVVVANVLAVTLRELGSQFVRLTVPGGSVVLSGMLAEQGAGVDDACASAGLRLLSQRGKDGWRVARYGNL